VFSESAELYDAIYGAFKDYATEAARIDALIKWMRLDAHTILDVGCGTGEHARHLTATHGYVVDGLDIDPSMLAVARRKLPDARFFQADMAAFDLGRRYDVVMCLFSSIGYLESLERVTAALRCFRRHLAADGAVIVEPWLTPDVFKPGAADTRTAESGGVRVERTSRTSAQGRLSTLVFSYRIEDASGVRVGEEVHRLGLFTEEEMLACFRDAGLVPSYDADGLTGRGIYVARDVSHREPDCDCTVRLGRKVHRFRCKQGG
jgi:ubiquinone/menaquinone biosynthesis C-methylase UbiE